MRTYIENEFIKIEVESLGAELTNLIGKKEDLEYLWQADPKVWARHAPILFPIVGKVKNNQYRIDEKTYSLSQHGFARDCEFALIEQTDASLTYELHSDEKTLEKYPYKFSLAVNYTLQENKVIVSYIVKNADDSTIWYSIGAHPGFNCPFFPDEKFEDYYFEFENKETAYKYGVSSAGLISDEKELCMQEENKILISRELFSKDALVFNNLESKKISLKSKNHHRKITVDFEGFPWLGLWSKPEKEATFVCIEPWLGVADHESSIGDFKKKEAIRTLEPKEIFSCSYSIEIGNF